MLLPNFCETKSEKRAIFSFPHMLQCTGAGPLWGNEVVLWHDEEIRHIITCVLLLHLLCQRLLHNVKHSKARRHGGFEEKSVGNEFLFPVCGHVWDITWRMMILHGQQQHLCCHALHPPIASLYRHVHWMTMCSLPRCFFLECCSFLVLCRFPACLWLMNTMFLPGTV